AARRGRGAQGGGRRLFASDFRSAVSGARRGPAGARPGRRARQPAAPIGDAIRVSTEHPFDRLTPDFILDAVEACGHRCDGRLLALNSYENRVYQVGLDAGEPLIAKFYRPGRWSDAAIDEEHAFIAELVE